MKKLLLALVFTTLSAQALEIKIASFKNADYSKLVPVFNINPSLGRAWVEVEATEEVSDPEVVSYSQVFPYKIQGLSFDAELNSVKYSSADLSINVTCAIGKKPKASSLKMTKQCGFLIKPEVRVFDDGYFVHNVDYRSVYLEIK